MKTVYGIAQVVKEPGHGGSYDYLAICPLGSWGENGYPPIFTKKGDAEAYVKGTDLRVVPLELR